MNKFEKSISEMIWECGKCGLVYVSNPLEHHKMDFCECGTGVDLETYSCRFMGNVKVIGRIKPNFKELRLKPCWWTCGKMSNKEFKIISVSDMSVEHMNAILDTQKLSEYIKWLIKKELKLRKLVKQELDLCFELQELYEKWDLNDGIKKYINLVDVIRLNKLNKEVLDSF